MIVATARQRIATRITDDKRLLQSSSDGHVKAHRAAT